MLMPGCLPASEAAAAAEARTKISSPVHLLRVHLCASCSCVRTDALVVGTGTVDIYLTNGSTLRLVPARDVFPSSDPNKTTGASGAGTLGGHDTASGSGRDSGELDEAALQAAQRELASLHVPGSRAAAIVKEIKVSLCRVA